MYLKQICGPYDIIDRLLIWALVWYEVISIRFEVTKVSSYVYHDDMLWPLQTKTPMNIECKFEFYPDFYKKNMLLKISMWIFPENYDVD